MLGERFVSESNANSRAKLTSILVGITAYTQKGHIARATLEATCFQTKAILNAMEKDSGKALAELAVDGGMTNSDLCMQVCDLNQAVSFQVANIE